MLGNHDRRRAFAEVFPEFAAGFRSGSHSFGGTDVLYLDTLDEQARDQHSGHLCIKHLDWLKTQLETGKGPVIILSHHHILNSGFDGMDAIHLRNSTEVADMIAASGRCQMVINGHIHRIIVSSYRGVTHVMIKSPCHQMPMVLGSGGLKPLCRRTWRLWGFTFRSNLATTASCGCRPARMSHSFRRRVLASDPAKPPRENLSDNYGILPLAGQSHWGYFNLTKRMRA